MHQAKSWRTSSNANKKELDKSKLAIEGLEEKLRLKDEELEKAYGSIAELRQNKEDVIDSYMDSDEFKKLMEKHDELVYPANYALGWKGGMDAVLGKHPGLFQISDFPCPIAPTELAELLKSQASLNEEDEEMVEGTPSQDRILDPTNSPLQAQSSSSSSGEETDSASSEGTPPRENP